MSGKAQIQALHIVLADGTDTKNKTRHSFQMKNWHHRVSPPLAFLGNFFFRNFFSSQIGLLLFTWTLGTGFATFLNFPCVNSSKYFKKKILSKARVSCTKTWFSFWFYFNSSLPRITYLFSIKKDSSPFCKSFKFKFIVKLKNYHIL